MGIDITWQAFDADEVERMWSEIPFGELVEKMKDDSLFWTRKRNLMPDELQKERRLYSGLEYAEEIIEHLARLGNNDKSVEWIIKNEGIDKFSREEIMYLDMDFIYYWSYDWCGDRYNFYALITQAVYLKQGLDYLTDDLPEETLTEQWLEAMRKVDSEIVASIIIYDKKLFDFESFPKINPDKMTEIEEEIQWALEDIPMVIDLLEFAKKHNLDIFVSSETNNFEDDGAGKNNLSSRCNKRFGQLASSSQ